jgi:hypothetical protein
MYSDSEVENIEVYDSQESSDEPNTMDLVEKQIEAHNDKLVQLFQAYEWMFDDDASFPRTNFPHCIRDHKTLSNRWDTKKSPDFFHAVSALLNATAADEGAEAERTPLAQECNDPVASAITTAAEAANDCEARAQNSADAGAPAAASATGQQTSGVYVPSPADGRPSPASRFPCENFTTCILISVDKSHKRADLRAAHAELLRNVLSVDKDVLDVVPGYVHAEASGWALPITTHPDVLAKLKSLYAGWRVATPADVQLFTRLDCTAGGTASHHQQQQTAPSRKAWTRNAAKLMRSKERFPSCVEAAGGWDNVVFVAVDVEAFAVTASSIPLPAEYAFVPIHRRTCRQAASAATHAEASPAATAPTPRVKAVHSLLRPRLRSRGGAGDHLAHLPRNPFDPLPQRHFLDPQLLRRGTTGICRLRTQSTRGAHQQRLGGESHRDEPAGHPLALRGGSLAAAPLRRRGNASDSGAGAGRLACVDSRGGRHSLLRRKCVGGSGCGVLRVGRGKDDRRPRRSPQWQDQIAGEEIKRRRQKAAVLLVP